MSFVSITPRGGALTARGGWSFNTTYFQDDIVVWNQEQWQSLLPVNQGFQPDISPGAWVSIDVPFAEYVNTVANRRTDGATPKLPVPVGTPGLRSDQFGNVIFGPSYAVTQWNPGSDHTFMPDGAILSNVANRLYIGSISMGAFDDPTDLNGRRFGPGGCNQYGGGTGSVSASAGANVTLTNAGNPSALSAFVVGQTVYGGDSTSTPVNVMPTGVTILSLNGGPVGNNITLTLSQAVALPNNATIFSAAREQDYTGLASGTSISQFKASPAVSPFNGTPTTPGAQTVREAAVVELDTAENPRTVTVAGDVAQGCEIRFFTCPIGQSSVLQQAKIAHNGHFLIGGGAIGAGDNGGLVQIRGNAGTNAVQRIAATAGVSSGTFALGIYPDPPTNGYPAPSIAAGPVPWNAAQADISTALTSLGLTNGVDFTLAGGPLPGTPITVTFIGATYGSHFWLPMFIDNTNLVGGTVSTSNTTPGLASDAASFKLFIRCGTTPTTDVIRVVDSSGANQFQLTAAFQTQVQNFLHQGANLGFYNHATNTKQTVTGSRAGNAALASLLTALNSIGLILDSSTA